MGTSYFPETILAQDTFILNFLENPAGVQFVHRCIAFIVVIAIALLWDKSRKLPLTDLQRKASNFMISVVIIQFLLGVITILYSVPITMGVLHQTGAFVLFAGLLFFMHSLRKAA
jgi:heme a synthase